MKSEKLTYAEIQKYCNKHKHCTYYEEYRAQKAFLLKLKGKMTNEEQTFQFLWYLRRMYSIQFVTNECLKELAKLLIKYNDDICNLKYEVIDEIVDKLKPFSIKNRKETSLISKYAYIKTCGKYPIWDSFVMKFISGNSASTYMEFKSKIDSLIQGIEGIRTENDYVLSAYDELDMYIWVKGKGDTESTVNIKCNNCSFSEGCKGRID